jgi:hypothetical protein
MVMMAVMVLYKVLPLGDVVMRMTIMTVIEKDPEQIFAFLLLAFSFFYPR